MTGRGGRGACGVSAPHDEVLLFRQKDPKPLAPGRGPSGAFAPVPTVRAAELAALRQSSPYNQIRHWGAATPAGAMRWRHEMARLQLQRITTRSFATLRMTDWEKQIPRFARNDNLEVDILLFIPVARGMGPSSRPGGFARRSWVTILCTSTSLCIWEAGRHWGSSSGWCLF